MQFLKALRQPDSVFNQVFSLQYQFFQLFLSVQIAGKAHIATQIQLFQPFRKFYLVRPPRVGTAERQEAQIPATAEIKRCRRKILRLREINFPHFRSKTDTRITGKIPSGQIGAFSHMPCVKKITAPSVAINKLRQTVNIVKIRLSPVGCSRFLQFSARRVINFPPRDNAENQRFVRGKISPLRQSRRSAFRQHGYNLWIIGMGQHFLAKRRRKPFADLFLNHFKTGQRISPCRNFYDIIPFISHNCILLRYRPPPGALPAQLQ